MLKYYFWFMNKRLFILLIALMSLSLLGIIFVQGYWISNSYRDKEDQINFNFHQVLNEVAEKIEMREIEDYYRIYSGLADSVNTPENINFSELVYTTRSDKNNDTYIFSDGILVEDYKLTYSFLDTEIDSILFKKIINKKSTTKIINGVDGSGTVSQTIESFSRMRDYERARFENAFKNISSRTPIHKRVKKEEIRKLLLKKMAERGLNSEVEFAIYSNGLSTGVHSGDFEFNRDITLEAPLFVNEELNTGYQLFVNFSGRNKTVIKSILGMAVLSLVFTSVIVLAYSNAISQIFKQRQISQIKSDFINNMTHEFKTPIATINLALDAIKNPKVKDDKEAVARYLKMIREENRRMNAQVENVLRISKLERNQLNLSKERVKLHDIITNAISHMSLIIEDRNGDIKTHLGALKSSVLASESHLTNVIVNVLDNAIKYSEEPPKIDIYTENVKDNIILEIRDQGIGMTKSVQKKIFEKFYRESTGNIHNVKGHGLGLAYAKRILDDHDAEFYVESEKGKGSTFIIKLHLIS